MFTAVKKPLRLLGVLLVVLGLLGNNFVASPINAQLLPNCAAPVSGFGVTLPAYEDGGSHEISINFAGSGLDPTDEYRIIVLATQSRLPPINIIGRDEEAKTGPFSFGGNDSGSNGDGSWQVNGNVVTWTITNEEALTSSVISGDEDTHYVALYDVDPGLDNYACWMGEYTTSKVPGGCDNIEVWQERNGNQCFSDPTVLDNSCLNNDDTIWIRALGLSNADGSPFEGDVEFVLSGPSNFGNQNEQAQNGQATISVSSLVKDTGNYTVQLKKVIFGLGANTDFPGCTTMFSLNDSCDDAGDPNACLETAPNLGLNLAIGGPDPYIICDQIDSSLGDEKQACLDCVGTGRQGIWTAIGCISRNPAEIAQSLIGVGLLMSGGIALLMILAAGFIISTSEGDPKRTNEGKDLLIAAVSAELLIAFSVTILQFIGSTVLRIPGFG